MPAPSGKQLDSLYKTAWSRGLKTTYYLRSLGATQMEKSVEEKTSTKTESADFELSASAELPKVCSILEPDCEASLTIGFKN